MGITSLALSVFSIIPMALSLANRVFLARLGTHIVRRYSKEKEMAGAGEALGPEEGGAGRDVAFWGTVSEAISYGDADVTKLPPEDDPDVQHLASVMLVFFVVCICLLAVYLVCSAALIYGACKAKRWFLMPWIVATFLFLLAYLGGVCLSIWLFGTRLEILLLLALAIVESAVGFYLWLCILSLFQILSSNEWRHGNGAGIGGNSDWEMKPRFTTTYNSVPTHD